MTLQSDADTLGRALGLVTKGVFLLSLRDGEGRALTPGTALINFSEQPPSLLFSMAASASLSPRLQAGVAVCLNVLAEDQNDLLEHCARSRGDERFARGDWHEVPGLAPWLSGCRAVLAGPVAEVWEHAGQLAVVVSLTRADAAPERSPLVYSGGATGRWQPF